MLNSAFYMFTPLNDLQEHKSFLRNLMQRLEMKGKVVLSPEGINGMVSGATDRVQQFQQELVQRIPGTLDMLFKNNPTKTHDFKRVVVKVKPEIITMKQEVDLSKTAPYVEPQELCELFESGRDDFITLDIRNSYEYEAGHFENSIKVDSEVFSEFPRLIEQLKPQLLGKKVISYCTGGVRCEKATILLREAGIPNVHQLRGGILNYGIQVGDQHWKGKCVVFDKRRAVDIVPSQQELERLECSVCNLASESTLLCPLCHTTVILCLFCTKRLAGCCSNACFRKRSSTSK